MVKFSRDSPWRWTIDEHSLIIHLAEPHRMLSWASLGGGMRRADTIINHQVALDDRAAAERPRQYLERLARRLRPGSRTVVA
jgi:adenosylcobinamide amidohydrolase